ncbi:helix-turn-helix domain-containing protein [Actinokineospora sp. PR83]|uniref:PucR family transcriptional regulator n=1 Tax=Actinokineospora sp. PR83 TaxID=2884908 RepID=UPI0027E148AC|nr:helix-turn-helix domain-containing protein [Actinokineospora sp. PR83]MCG8917439.1 helix-turn-helix domain-containing protein [Actinokineospora sp. PR83]
MVDLVSEPGVADVSVYRDTGGTGVPPDEKVRRELIDRLLEGRFTRRSELSDAARVLELPEDGLFVVLYGDGSTDEARPEVSATAVDPSRRRVIVWRSLPDAEIGIVSVERVEDFDGLRAALAASGQVIGVSRPVSGLARVPAALRRARIARRCLPPGETGVAVFGERPVTTLVAGAPNLARELAIEVLAGLDVLGVEERAELLTTLRLWFAHGGAVKAVAELMSTHPNTVRYRLRRAAEVTGRDMEDPRDVGELYLAVEATRLTPDGPPAG